MSACILPLAPDFQDPLASPNYSPVIRDTQPEAGSVVLITDPQMAVARFRATISDPNVGDELHIRWLVDYPPVTSNTRVIVPDMTIPPAAEGMVVEQEVSIEISCANLLSPLLMSHQVMLVVADRDFATSAAPTDLTALATPEGFAERATWTLNLECR